MPSSSTQHHSRSLVISNHSLDLAEELAGVLMLRAMLRVMSGVMFGGIIVALSLARSLRRHPGNRQRVRCPALQTTVSTREWNRFCMRMTLEEKVGQLVQYSAGQPTGPGTGRTDYDDMIARGQIGSLFNVVDPREINKYQKIAMEKSRLHIPILFGLDVIHGFKTEFPIPLGLASTWDPSIVEKASRVAAMEASADGIRWTFSPMVDIARDARWGRMAEGAGEDPFLGSAMAAAYVRGYQGARSGFPRTALRRAPSTMSAMARPRVGATTTAPRFPNIPCASSICRHFTRPWKPERHR